MIAPGSCSGRETPVRLAAAAAIGYTPSGCDRPRGATFAAARPCAAPGTRDVTPDPRARRAELAAQCFSSASRRGRGVRRDV